MTLVTKTFEAKNRLYQATAILVPFFDSRIEQLTPHVRLLNQLGFTVVTFELKIGKWPWAALKAHPQSDGQVGLKHLWAKQIAEILDQVSDQKILFTLSNPTSSTLEAMTYRKTKSPYDDIQLMICDGGPFDLMWTCTENLLEHYYRWKNPLLRKILNIGMFTLWSPNHHKSLHQSMRQIPKGFPILSIRAGQDELVPPKAIQEAFRGHDQIHLEVLDLPEAKHLKGLRDYSEIYRAKVAEFTLKYAE
jgi:hypothetical protein